MAQPDLVIYLQARLDVLLQPHQEAGPGVRAPLRRRLPGEPSSRAYNDFFFHYTDTPLLVINTCDIDFVHNEADLDNLVSVIRKMRKGVHHYLPLAARASSRGALFSQWHRCTALPCGRIAHCRDPGSGR